MHCCSAKDVKGSRVTRKKTPPCGGVSVSPIMDRQHAVVPGAGSGVEYRGGGLADT